MAKFRSKESFWCRWCKPQAQFFKLIDMQRHALSRHKDILFPPKKEEKPKTAVRGKLSTPKKRKRS